MRKESSRDRSWCSLDEELWGCGDGFWSWGREGGWGGGVDEVLAL